MKEYHRFYVRRFLTESSCVAVSIRFQLCLIVFDIQLCPFIELRELLCTSFAEFIILVSVVSPVDVIRSSARDNKFRISPACHLCKPGLESICFRYEKQVSRLFLRSVENRGLSQHHWLDTRGTRYLS